MVEPPVQDKIGLRRLTVLLKKYFSQKAPFPKRCLRGLRRSDWITEGRRIYTDTFVPDERPQNRRIDGGYETSINWEDDDKAITFTLSRIDQAKFGVAVLPLVVLEEENRRENTYNKLAWERKREPKNDYHGNIIFSCELDPRARRMLAGVLANRSTYIPQPKNE